MFAGKAGTIYSVTNTLAEGATNSNAATEVYEGTTYSAVLTMADGMDIETISVTMGGVDVTKDDYDDGNIFILSVSGDLGITVAVKASTLLYQLPSETVFDGATQIDTGIQLLRKIVQEPFSITMELSSEGSQYAFWCGDSTTMSYGLWHRFRNYRHEIDYGTGFSNIKGGSMADHVKCVVVHDGVNNNVVTHFVNTDGSVKTETISPYINSNNFTNVTQNLLLGHSLQENAYFMGTIHEFSIYGEALPTEAIYKYLGV